jgi:hypothetical protein
VQIYFQCFVFRSCRAKVAAVFVVFAALAPVSVRSPKRKNTWGAVEAGYCGAGRYLALYEPRSRESFRKTPASEKAIAVRIPQ